MLRVSAVIPTYNRREQVIKAIESVLAQTVPVDEIIVVDDGSTDGTADTVRNRFGTRVRLFTQKNTGVSAARNRGIGEAQAEWIAFLDSDDVWFPTKIERQFEALALLGERFSLCYTDCVYEGDPARQRSIFEETGFAHALKFGSVEEPLDYILAGREPFWTQSLLVRRSLLQDLHGFDESLVVREDTDLLFRLSFRTAFSFVAEPLVRIDRARSREGLCNLYFTEGDRIYNVLKRLYTKWLALPEVVGSKYEKRVKELLRDVYYSSAESKIRGMRLDAALGDVRKLNRVGDSYASVFATLLRRKIGKLRRFGGGARTGEDSLSAPGHASRNSGRPAVDRSPRSNGGS